MADTKKTLTEKAAEKSITAITASAPEKKAEASQLSPVKKETSKKAQPTKRAAETAKKATSAKKSASSARKTEVAKKASQSNEINLDTITTALWKRFEKADVSEIKGVIAIQIEVDNLGIFFICVKNGEKHIIQSVYNDRDGTLCCSANDIMAIAKGGFDFLSAIKNGTLRYQGDVTKGLQLKALF
ncbi:MAG: SCP2 sterol-binding domain-containing protein [Eubacterium sp.]|nr:SCP2 sterol-binding domain-containing protein [Eubacterium sp.]